jgi:transcriptional regulator with XRE-family HTH domain
MGKKKMLTQDFGGALKTAREAAGLTQASFAKELSTPDDPLTDAAISSWERGVHEPEPRRWPRIASLLEERSPTNKQIHKKLFGGYLSSVHHDSLKSTRDEGMSMQEDTWMVTIRTLSQRIADLEEELRQEREKAANRPARTGRT